MDKYSVPVREEIVACVGGERDPSPADIRRLAREFHREMFGRGPSSTWRGAVRDGAERRWCQRLAEVALTGDPCGADGVDGGLSMLLPMMPSR